MEYAHSLSAIPDLFVTPTGLVLITLLPVAFVLGRPWHVFSVAALDGPRHGGSHRRSNVCLWRTQCEFRHVAEPRRHFQLVSLGVVARAQRLPKWRPKPGLGCFGRNPPDACRGT